MTEPTSDHPVLGDIECGRPWSGRSRAADHRQAPGGRSRSPIPRCRLAGDPRRADDRTHTTRRRDRGAGQAGGSRASDGIRSKNGARASLTITTPPEIRHARRSSRFAHRRIKGDRCRAQDPERAVGHALSGSWSAGDPRKARAISTWSCSARSRDRSWNDVTSGTTRRTSRRREHRRGQKHTASRTRRLDKAIDDSNATLDQEQRKAAYARALKLPNDQST